MSDSSFEAIFNQSPLSMVIYKADGKIERVNDAFVKMWGARLEDINPGYNVLQDEQMKQYGFMPIVEKAFAGETSNFPLIEYDGRANAATSNKHWVKAALYPIKNNEGKIIQVIGMHEDITQKVLSERALLAAKEDAESASRIKSKFIDIAAHELKTPLTPLTLLVQKIKLLLSTNKEIPDNYIDRMEQQIFRLTKLVDDLLNISRLEHGGLVLRPTRTDLIKLLQECTDDFKNSTAKVGGLIFEGPDKALFMSLDPTRISQVVWNLLDNAVKYSPPKTPIRITLEEKENSVRVSITDQGPGIPLAKQAELFSKFYRVNTDTTYTHAGMGLGLYICRKIINGHGGTISVTSDTGKGSTFFFDLPKTKT
jgi:PAS domain S-box-containing protein